MYGQETELGHYPTKLSQRDIATIQAIYKKPADVANPPGIKLSHFPEFQARLLKEQQQNNMPNGNVIQWESR